MTLNVVMNTKKSSLSTAAYVLVMFPIQGVRDTAVCPAIVSTWQE
jgi:hypothetical protein